MFTGVSGIIEGIPLSSGDMGPAPPIPPTPPTPPTGIAGLLSTSVSASQGKGFLGKESQYGGIWTLKTTLASNEI